MATLNDTPKICDEETFQLDDATQRQQEGGTELALFRARLAFEAGWRLSPEEAQAYAFPARRLSSRSPSFVDDDEDEASELSLGFGDN